MSVEINPQTLIDTYGPDAVVAVGPNGMKMALGQALEAERLLCPADMADREDPAKRVGYVASMLAAGGSLLPEHEYLLDRPS